MKKILFVLSILTLMSYGCNRNQEDTGVGAGGNMQQEESRSEDIQMEEDRPGQTPGFEKEEYRDDRTDLGQERPDLEEEMEN